MVIVFLKFGPNRAQAGRWLADHQRWIEQGIADGAFLMAGSLDGGQGGVVLAATRDRSAIEQRIAQDPFVVHGVVTAEIHAVAPSRSVPVLAALLDGAVAAAPAR